MSSKDELVVVLDAPELGRARPVGVLTRGPGPRLSVAFQYARTWLRDTENQFALDPGLPLIEALVTVPNRQLPGIIADTAPDRWGEELLRRRAGRELDAWGVVTAVADATRMGALRLRRGPNGPFVSDADPAIPPLTSLRDLQAAVQRFEADPDAPMSDPSLAALIAPGSSLGGVRPKANHRAPDGSLWIAKFPSTTDRRDVGAWEHVYAELARSAGVEVAPTTVLDAGGSGHTFATRRFDRTPAGRRLYASALTLSGGTTGEGADYADIAAAIRRSGAASAVESDLSQAYRRLAFNVLAGNRDDHLRNHGFLRTREGWRLAPAFDLTPAREMREHATAVNGQTVGVSRADVLAARNHFGIAEPSARAILSAVADALGPWRTVAAAVGISRHEQDLVGPAFAALETHGT